MSAVQAFVPYLAERHVSGMTVYVRTSLDPKQLIFLVRRKVQQLNANIPLYGMQTYRGAD